MAITWDPRFALGVEAIDDQHREIFRRVDVLLDAVRSGRSTREVGKLIAFLGDYVITHFREEEALMRDRAYPGLALQQAQHAAFIQEIGALRTEHERDGASALLVVRVNARVTAWLFDHIVRADGLLSAFLHETAAAARPRA